jgi:hypothetical protein
MLLLIEKNENRVDYLIEKDVDSDEKKYYVQGIFMQSEIQNKNKRIYPLSVLENETNRFINENVKKNKAYGELSHPSGPSINPDRIALHIKDIHREGNNFLGKALVASTPMGNIVKGLLKDGANLGVSSRALGSLKPIKDGLNEVQSDLRLLAIDVVTDPSAPDAYVRGIMESKSWVWDAAREMYIEQDISDIKSSINKMSLKEIDTQKIKMFENFLKKISRYKI